MRRAGTGILLAIGALLAARPAGAEVTARVRVTPAQIRVGETAEIAVEVRGAQNVAAPQLGQPSGLAIRYVGPQTEVSIVNGKMSASVTHRFAVTGIAAGSYTLGPVLLDHQGQQVDAGSASLVVQAGGAPPARGAPAPGGGGNALRLVLATPRPDAFLHERVPITLELWVGNVRVGDLQYPTVPGEGFAMEKLPEPTQRREATADGTFDVVRFETLLTPLRAGTVTIGPAHMGLRVVERRGHSPFDQFFGGDPFGLAGQPIEVTSEPLVLTVRPLPDAGRPDDFSGAVGQFDFDVQAAPREVAAGDPVTLTLTLRGTGNLEQASPPVVASSDALRAYPAQPRAPKPGEPPVPAGTKTLEQVVIPQQAGTLELPPLTFSWFDPEAHAYRSVTRGPIALAVRQAAPGNAGPAIVGARPEPKPSATLGADIVTIKDTPGDLVPVGVHRWRSAGFWAWQPVPLLLWIGAVLVDRRRRRLAGDVRRTRSAGAGSAARAALAEARRALDAGDHAAALDRTARAVAEYLAAKLDLPPGTATARAAERLHANGIDAAVVRDLESILATLERARFAPGAAADLGRTLAQAQAVVRALERQRRLARGLAVALVVVGVAVAVRAAVPEGAATTFFRGNTLYGEGRFADAAAEYEKVLAAGSESGNLYYNLGNAWFRAGDLGRTLLGYERARRRIPRDPDLRANLAFARERAGDAEDESILAQLLFPLASRMTADELLLLASAAYSVVLLVLAAGRFAAPVGRVARPVALAAGAVLAVVLPSAVWRLATVDLPARAVVVAREEVTVRFEPTPAGTAHFAVGPGAVLRLLGEREGWAQVAGRDGRRGWLPLDAVARL
ncbi:MAG: BatD family protein [Candidatus Binatia bacterium]